jgi:dihydroxy-acid dehydratase
VVDGIKQAPARAMLRAVGFTAAQSAAECSGATSCPCSRRSVAGLSVKISDAALLEVERTAIPGAGSCGGMYTANTMAHCCVRGIRPGDILTWRAFENAITLVIALGGSTNAVLHLLVAIAQAARVRLGLDDFTKVGRRVPVLADVWPSGRYLMSELIAIDGIQPLMKKDSHLIVLYGNLAPAGAVAKISGQEGLSFTGRARTYNGEEAATAAILAGKVRAGDGVVIRYEGPKGGPGMREILSPAGAVVGCGLADQSGTDYRRPLFRRHAWVRGRTHRARGGRRWTDRVATKR